MSADLSVSVEWRDFDHMNLVSPDAGAWIMPIIREGHAKGIGLDQIAMNIRDQGIQLSREEKKTLGVRANFKLGDQFTQSLTKLGRENPGYTAASLVQINYRIPLISSIANKMRNDDNFRYLYFIAAGWIGSTACDAAQRLAKSGRPRGRILRVEAPEIPLRHCDKLCSCWYSVKDDCID